MTLSLADTFPFQPKVLTRLAETELDCARVAHGQLDVRFQPPPSTATPHFSVLALSQKEGLTLAAATGRRAGRKVLATDLEWSGTEGRTAFDKGPIDPATPRVCQSRRRARCQAPQ